MGRPVQLCAVTLSMRWQLWGSFWGTYLCLAPTSLPAEPAPNCLVDKLPLLCLLESGAGVLQ